MLNRECLANCVKNADGKEVMCPWFSGDHKCEQYIQDREIRALLTQEEYEMLSNKSVLNVMATSDEKSFLCPEPDCKGACFYTEGIRFYDCSNCKKTWCIKCKQNHDSETQCDLERIEKESKLTNEQIEVN